MKFIFLGDVVGEPGRDTLRAAIPLLRERYQPDFFVVNGENAAGGNGITPRLAVDLMRAGADVITTIRGLGYSLDDPVEAARG